MNAVKLTCREDTAHSAPMEKRLSGLTRVMIVVMAMSSMAALPGCITVNAPEDKIVIELNINIKQEVLYKIENEVQKAVEQNSGIF